MKNGFSLVEILIVMMISAIIALFAFDSIKQVIMASARVQRRMDFNTLSDEIGFITSRLDQCTCNFQGLTWNAGQPRISLPPPGRIVRFQDPQAAPSCNPAGATVIAEVGQTNMNSQVQSLEILDVQYMQLMNLMRARLQIRAQIPQEKAQGLKTVSRSYPLLFSTLPSGAGARVVGCIGMTD